MGRPRSLRRMRAAGVLSLALLAPASFGCSRITSFPSETEERSPGTCSDGRDNDLDGDTDCADDDCQLSCPTPDVVMRADLTPCFVDADLDLEFQEVIADQTTDACEPWPADPPECDRGTVLFPGTEDCMRLGAECPTPGPFPDEAGPAEESGAPVFVRAGEEGGTGTVDSPLGTLAEAVDTAPDGGMIVLAAGEYEAVEIRRPVHIRGVCVTGARIAAGAHPFRVAAEGVHLERLTVSAAETPAVEVAAAAGLELSDSVIEDAHDAGILVAGRLDARRLVVRGVEGMDAAGIRATAGAALSLAAVRIDDVLGDGIAAEGADLEMTAASIMDVAGAGVRIGTGTQATLDGLVIASRGTESLVVECGEASEADPCVHLRRSFLSERRGDARGIRVASGHLLAERTRIESPLHHGLLLEGGRATLTNVAVSNTRDPVVEELTGTAIEARPGTELSLQKVRLRSNLYHGIVAEGSRVRAFDLEVLGGLERQASQGTGISLREGSLVSLIRFLIEGAGACGIDLQGNVSFVPSEGVISLNDRGVCVAGTDIDVVALTSRVTYDDNGRNVVVRED